MTASYYSQHSSPLGNIIIAANEEAIIKVSFTEENESFPSPVPNSIIENCITQLNDYFKGHLTKFELPIKQEGTPFQQGVWKALLNVPYGKTESYLQLSQRLGNTKAIRAVGRANGKNDIAIIVPCHRIIGTNGSLVGYAGGKWRKKWLLEHEGKNSGRLLSLF